MSFIGDLLGSENDYRASGSNPYNIYGQEALQQQLNNQGQVFQQQQGLAGQLQAQASGMGPSVSQTMLNQALQQQQGSAAAMAAGNRGINSGLAMRQALQAQNMAGAQATAQGVAARQQEQLNAQGQLGSLYNSMGNQTLSQQQLMNNANLGVSQVNADITNKNTQGKNQLTGSIFNAGGGVAAAALAHGGRVQGKASVQGDSAKNDVVPAMLSPGEIVIPRSKASDPELAKEFIDHLMSEKNSGSKDKSYLGVLEAHRKLGDAIAALEKKGAKK